MEKPTEILKRSRKISEQVMDYVNKDTDKLTDYDDELFALIAAFAVNAAICIVTAETRCSNYENLKDLFYTALETALERMRIAPDHVIQSWIQGDKTAEEEG